MRNLKCINSTPNLILLVCLAIFISSCSKDDDQLPPAPPPVTINGISQEIKDLIYYKGDENAPVVLINAQGGPDTSLGTEEVDFITEYFDTTNLLTVNVYQGQSLNPSLLTDNDITFDQAVSYNAESIEILDQVIKFFKGQGRTVYILGASFGAFVTQELIATKGINVADKYLIMIGRLDINDAMWLAMAEGRIGYFENGITPIVDSDPAPDLMERNLNRIAAGLAINRYTQRLNTIEDLSNVTYVYGETDQFVGRLSPEEVDFLESKNVNIIAGSGGHDATFFDFIAQGLDETFGIKEK